MQRAAADTEPLIDRPPGAVLFLDGPRAVTAAVFLAEARCVAARLPPAQELHLLCQDRYAFAVAFAACLLGGRTALLNAPTPGPDALTDVLVRDAASHPAAACLDAPAIPASHVAAIVFTSGSTGAPVAHPKRWGALVQRSRAAALMFPWSPTVLGTVPPQHMYGFETTILLPLHAPVASRCGPAFFPADIADAAPGATLVTTPLQIRTLLASRVALPAAAIVSATAPLPPDLAAQAEAAWDVPVFEIFGATECGSIARRRTTQGPLWTRYPGITLDFDDAGTTVRAPLADPVRLADVIEPAADGFHLLGRRTDLVKLGGRRASLPNLERMLLGIPGIMDGALLVPDEADSRLVAIVVAPGRTGASILADLRRIIEPVFVPRRVIQVERLPRNPLGKLPREALLALLASL